jgi:hypothetical protein
MPRGAERFIRRTSDSERRGERREAAEHQAPIARQPGKTPLNDPAARLHLETTATRLPFDNFDLPAAVLPTPVSEVLATLCRIGPDLLQARHTEGEARQQIARAGGD